MAMQALVMPPFEFEPKDSNAQRWTKWISRFNNYLLAVDISDPKRQKAMLLHMVGEELHNIFQTLQVADPGINETVYDKAKAAFSDYFAPKRNLEFELFIFRQAQQEQNEDLDSFYSRLKRLSVNCQFTNAEAAIKSQMIQKCTNRKVREEGLCKADISLTDLLKVGRTHESSRRQSKLMEEKISKSGHADSVHKMSDPKQHKKFKWKKPGETKKYNDYKKRKTCYNCGGHWPHPKGKKCPAFGKICDQCSKPNHFKAMCTKQKKHVHAMEPDFNDESDEYGVMFHMNHVSTGMNQPCSKNNVYNVKVEINGVKTDMEVDTGSSISVMTMSMKNFRKLTHPKAKPCLLKSNLILKTYTGEVINPEGVANVDVCYKDQYVKNFNLTVVPGHGPSLLGRDWLSSIRLDSHEVKKISTRSPHIEAIYIETI